MKIVCDGKIISTDVFDLENVTSGISFENDLDSTLYEFKYSLNGKIGKKYPDVTFSVFMRCVELGEIKAILTNGSGAYIRASVFMNATEKNDFLCALLHGTNERFRNYVFWKNIGNGEY